MSLALTSIEPIEDLLYLCFLNPLSFVCDPESDKTIFFFRLNCDWFSRRGVEVGIPNDMSQDFSCPGFESI